jgi:hypothetical protein
VKFTLYKKKPTTKQTNKQIKKQFDRTTFEGVISLSENRPTL